MFTPTHQRKLGLLVVLLALLMTLFAQAALAQDVPATPVEIVGLIESMTLDSVTINGQVINITAAQIATPLQVGFPVKIEGVLMPDASIVAREVNAPEADTGVRASESEIVGVVSSFDGTTLVISGLTIDVSQAEVTSGITVGSLAKVHVTFSNNAWVAREAEPFTSGQSDNSNDNTGSTNDNTTSNDNQGSFGEDEFELIGTLTEIGNGYIVVSGQTISTANAEIKDQLVTGALVKVHLSQVSGQLAAREAELVGRSSEDSDDSAVVVPPNCTASQPAGWVAYTIRAGDTLSGIAARSDSHVRDLVMINCVTDPRVITAGATIFVPQEPAQWVDNGNDNSDDHSNDDRGNDNHDDDHSNDNHGDDDHNDDHNDDHDDDHSNDNHGDDDHDS